MSHVTHIIGVVAVDPHQRRLSLCTLAGQVEGQLEFHTIMRVSRVMATVENKSEAPGAVNGTEDSKVPGTAERSERRSKCLLEDADTSISHCARIECVGGKELEIWLQDSVQCHSMIVILEAYILGEHGSSWMLDSQSTEGAEVHQDDSLAKKPALWTRYLAAHALSEMQETIERAIDQQGAG